jgi:hypothetical protein
MSCILCKFKLRSQYSDGILAFFPFKCAFRDSGFEVSV